MDAILVTENLSKSFNRGRVKALQNVSLCVNAGTIFGLLGPNGAGKTTFIKIILGLLRPQQGSASLFGIPVSKPEARKRTGYLPENHRFPGYLTGLDFLYYCARLSGLNDKKQREKNAEKLLKQVKMWEWRKTKIKKYSKGMLQRLGLAQALVHDPDIVFLDEPTDGVDPIGRKEIRDMMLELKARGKTIFLNSHLLSEVETICDEVAILNQGKVVRQGTIRELTTSDRRYRIHADFQNRGLAEKVASMARVYKTDPFFLELSVSGPEQLNQIIDLLRNEGCLIQGIVPEKKSLEESFIQAIQQDGGGDLNAIFTTLHSEKENTQ